MEMVVVVVKDQAREGDMNVAWCGFGGLDLTKRKRERRRGREAAKLMEVPIFISL